MADFTNAVLVYSNGSLRNIGASDRIVLTEFKVTGAVDFTGATLTGVAVSTIADAVASIALDGAGNLTSTSLVSAAITASGAVSIRGGTGNNRFGNSTAYIQFATGAVSFSGVTTWAASVTGNITLDSSGGSISIGGGANAQNINIATGGTRTVTLGTSTTTLVLQSNGGATTWQVADNSATSWKLWDGANTYVGLDTTDNAEVLTVNAAILLGKGALGTGALIVAGTADATLATGDVVAIYSNTGAKIAKAEADSATAVLRRPLGVMAAAAASSGSTAKYAFSGIQNVTFDANVADTDVGKPVYLSGTAGKATLTAPTSSATDVWQLGLLVDGAPGAGSTTGAVLLQLQYLYSIA
jgi:hypothetical protein